MAYLNFKHLRYFWAVAHDGNLTHAADTLNVSQSALSVQIKKLEEQLGHSLFDRRGRKLHLTEAGRIVLDHADAIFSTGDQLVGTLAGDVSARPILRVGAMATLSRNFQIGLLRPILKKGEASLELRSGTPEALLEDLEALSLDVVLLSTATGKGHASTFRSHRLSEQQVSLVGTPARLRKESDPRKILSEHPLILPASHGSIRTGFDAFTQRLGVTPNIIAEADDMAMMRLLSREDIGVAILPPVVVKDELASGQLVEACQLAGVFETFYAVTADRRFPNPLLSLVLQSAIDKRDEPL